MKIYRCLRILAVLGLLTLLLTGCTENVEDGAQPVAPTSATQHLTNSSSKRWYFYQSAIYNGDEPIPPLQLMDACERDDGIVFSVGGKMEAFYGTQPCGPNSDRPEIGNWKFQYSETELLWDIGGHETELQIVKLDADNLHLRYRTTYDEDYEDLLMKPH